MFKNGVFYNYITKRFYSKRQATKKSYFTIYVKNSSGTYTTMIVPYIICALFRNDYLKHGKNEKNEFKYIDGDPGNCDSDNIVANYYDYKIIKNESNGIVLVDICGYEVLLDYDFYINELHKYNFRPILNGSLVYFICENSGKVKRLHQIVMSYYYPDNLVVGVIDHQNHNTLDNTIKNLNPINHIINSMNNMDIHPNWDEKKEKWSVRYKIDGVGHSKSFSVYKYKTKELAYKKAMEYIETFVIPYKQKYIKEKDIAIKKKEFYNLVQFFINNNMIEEIIEELFKSGVLNNH